MLQIDESDSDTHCPERNIETLVHRAPSITGVRLFELADITRLKSGSLVGFELGHAKFGAPAPRHSDQLAVVAANAIGRLLNRDDGTTGLYLDLSEPGVSRRAGATYNGAAAMRPTLRQASHDPSGGRSFPSP